MARRPSSDSRNRSSGSDRVSRIGSLVVPDFQAAALVRAEPELRGCALVVCQGATGFGTDGTEPSTRRDQVEPRSVLTGVSPEARRLGVVPGMTVAQAIARRSSIVVRPADPEAERAGRQALAEVATSVSPRIEVGDGVVLLDVDGLDHLFGSPSGVAAALSRRAEQVGFDVGVGLADHVATAALAAGTGAARREAVLVPPGRDRDWMAPLSLGPVARFGARRAPAHEERHWTALLPRLEALGVRRCRDLGKLSRTAVATRFGHVGALLWGMAAGQDPTRLSPEPPTFEIEEGMQLEYGVASLEALLFVLRGLIDRVVSRLKMQNLACRGLTLSFQLEDGAAVERNVGVLAPTVETRSLLLLARTAIESTPPHAPIWALRVRATPDRARAVQMDLFRPAGPAPAELATTLARLSALCGEDRVGTPVPPTGHRPEAWRMGPFEAGEGRGSSKRGGSPKGAAKPGGETDAFEAHLALRAIRPPRPAQVFQERGRIAYVRAPGLGGRAVVTSGPWRIEAEWWGSPCRRDYYDVQLSDGGIYRLYVDLESNRPSWFVDGHYD